MKTKRPHKSILGLVLKLEKLLIAPLETVDKPDELRMSRVAAALLLISLVMVGIELLVAGNVPVLVELALFGGYWLARTRWYKAATWLLIFLLVIPSYSVVLTLPHPGPNRVLAAFSWIAIPLILGSLLYSFPAMTLFSLVNLVAISLLPFIRLELNYYVLSGALGFLVIISATVLVVMNQRKKLEQDRQAEREKLISELEKKNAELERFTYTVSHDLKSPLITINGFLGQLQDDIASGNTDRIEQDSQRIHQAVDKMHQLLRELLELSRIGRLMNPPEPVAFEELAREALVLVHGQLELRGVTVTLEPNLPVVYGDRQRLVEVLQNLVDNAANCMGEQSDPHIEIGQRGEEDGKLVFYVKDNGIGIAPEYHERIFGLFEKLDAKTEGTGIGLALVKRIVEFHGGRIWVESEPGKGATFYFTLESGEAKP